MADKPRLDMTLLRNGKQLVTRYGMIRSALMKYQRDGDSATLAESCAQFVELVDRIGLMDGLTDEG